MTDTGDKITVNNLKKPLTASLECESYYMTNFLQQFDSAKISEHDWASLPQLAIEKIAKHLLQIEQFNGPRNIQANLSVNYHWHQAVKNLIAPQPIEKMKIIPMNHSARASFLTYLSEFEDRLENLKHLEI